MAIFYAFLLLYYFIWIGIDIYSEPRWKHVFQIGLGIGIIWFLFWTGEVI